MKNIKVTTKQEKQLLEMANKLFSEEGKFFKLLCNDLYYSKNGKFPGFSINWYEFSMTHLLDEICDRRTRKYFGFDPWAYDKLMKKLIWKCKFYDNPIDFLYKQFKKLK